MPDGPLAILASVVLVLTNAFFVASEFAMVKMRRSRLEELVRQENRNARVALAISRRLDAYLSANQLGITLASLALGWIGEPALAGFLMPRLAVLGSWSSATAHALAVSLGLLTITFLHTVLGELVPKSLAIQRTEAVALWTAQPLRAFYWAMFPFIWFLNGAASLVLRLLGLPRVTEIESLHSPEELRLIVQGVELEPGVRRVMDRLFDYSRRVVKDVMTRGQDVVTLDAQNSWEENLAIAFRQQYTRYPLLDGRSGPVLGYVHLKDIVSVLGSKQVPPDMRTLAREPILVRAATPLHELRRAFLRQRVHLATVVDAHGALVGIVTLEDLLEEFVGEIQDEQDASERPPIVRQPDGGFEVDGRVPLDVVARELGLVLRDSRGDRETLDSYVASRFGEPARTGASLIAAGVRLTVLEIENGRIARLRGEPAA